MFVSTFFSLSSEFEPLIPLLFLGESRKQGLLQLKNSRNRGLSPLLQAHELTTSVEMPECIQP